jgi:hypothetical protein
MSELIEALLKNRAKDLLKGVTNLLQDEKLVERFYNHPLVYALYDGEFSGKAGLQKSSNAINKRKLPSYIPARTFALSLLGVLGVEGTTAANSVQALRDTINKINVEDIGSETLESMKQALLAMVDDAQGDVNRLRVSVENWYDGTMDRVSGWYKRRVQWIIFGLGLLAAVVLNVDTIYIANTLLYDIPLRTSLVAAAQEYAKGDATTRETAAKQRLEESLERIQQLGLPIGWSKRSDISGSTLKPRTEQNKFLMIFGWVFTGLAVSLGAPFWFDLLNKIMVIRSTVKPHEKSPEETSEDRQNAQQHQNSNNS